MQKAAALIKKTAALFEKRFLKETGRNTDRRYRRYEAGAPAVGAKDTEPCLWQEMQKIRNRGSGRRCRRLPVFITIGVPAISVCRRTRQAAPERLVGNIRPSCCLPAFSPVSTTVP
jgi:hypothetical protein